MRNMRSINDWFYSQYLNVKNLIRWFPVIWQDRDFDDAYIYKLLYKKFDNMEQFFRSDRTYSVEASDVANQLCEAKELVSKLLNDNYLEDELDKTDYDEKYGHIDIVENVKKDEQGRYVWEMGEGQSKLLGECGDRGRRQREQDKNKLFELIKNNIDEWWD